MNHNKEFVVIAPKETFINTQQKPANEKRRPLDEKDLLRSAKAEAERIVEAANSRATEIEEAARQEGHRKGMDEAQREMALLISAQTQEAKHVFEKLEAYRQQLHHDLLDSALDLSFDIAEKIINIHLKKDDTIYVDIAKAAIKALNTSSKFALRVSRSEYDRFFAKGGQWLRDDMGCADFEVICDANLPEGGCIVESDAGVVNAGVSEQMDKLRRIADGRTGADEEL
jgi:flagellar biosynthesis/type III secretory pathway protein FliH